MDDRRDAYDARSDLTLLVRERQSMLLCPEHLAAYEWFPDDAGTVEKIAPAIGHCAACLFEARAARWAT